MLKDINIKEIKEITIIEHNDVVCYKNFKIGNIIIRETKSYIFIKCYNINKDMIYEKTLIKDTETILEDYGLTLLQARKELINFFEGVLYVH